MNKAVTFGGRRPAANDPKHEFEKIELPPPGNENAAYDRIIDPSGYAASVCRTALSRYLQRFRDRKVCIAFWERGGNRFEKCGILTDVGDDFVAIKEQNSGRLIITHIDKIKYINVLCM